MSRQQHQHPWERGNQDQRVLRPAKLGPHGQHKQRRDHHTRRRGSSVELDRHHHRVGVQQEQREEHGELAMAYDRQCRERDGENHRRHERTLRAEKHRQHSKADQREEHREAEPWGEARNRFNGGRSATHRRSLHERIGSGDAGGMGRAVPGSEWSWWEASLRRRRASPERVHIAPIRRRGPPLAKIHAMRKRFRFCTPSDWTRDSVRRCQRPAHALDRAGPGSDRRRRNAEGPAARSARRPPAVDLAHTERVSADIAGISKKTDCSSPPLRSVLESLGEVKTSRGTIS